MAPAEGADDKAEPNVAAQALQSSDGSDGGASDDKEDEEETKFVEWDPSGRFGRVRSRPPRFFFSHSCAVSPTRMRRGFGGAPVPLPRPTPRSVYARARATRQPLLPRARRDPSRGALFPSVLRARG